MPCGMSAAMSTTPLWTRCAADGAADEPEPASEPARGVLTRVTGSGLAARRSNNCRRRCPAPCVERAPARVRTATAPSAVSASAWTTRLATTANPARDASPALTARLRVDEDELPFVVMRPALIGPDRFRGALAGDAKNSTLRPSGTLRTERRGWSVLGWTRLSSRPSLPAAPRSWCGLTSLPAAPGRWGGLTNLACCSACRAQRDEITVRDGVLVFLAKIVPLDQYVDARGQILILCLIQPDRANVLQAAEDKFFFLLALRLVTPDWHRDRHQDGHDRQHHEQRGHRVAALVETPRSRLTP